MREKEKSGISAGDAKRIGAFLSARSSPGGASAPTTPRSPGASPSARGGTIYGAATHANLGSAVITPDLKLPCELTIGDVRAEILAVTWKETATSEAEAIVSVKVNGRNGEIAARLRDGKPQACTPHTVREWKIATRSFSLDLVVLEGTPPVGPEDRPTLTLASMVVQPMPATPPSAEPVPAPVEKDPGGGAGEKEDDRGRGRGRGRGRNRGSGSGRDRSRL
jgi:hypothetical protein